jgi:hypothetical protein
MDEEKKQYRVTNPVAWGGRRERGEILELTAKEAVEIGEVEPVIVAKVAPAPEETPAVKASEATGDYVPVKTPEELADEAKVETEAEAVAPTPTEKKKKKS